MQKEPTAMNVKVNFVFNSHVTASRLATGLAGPLPIVGLIWHVVRKRTSSEIWVILIIISPISTMISLVAWTMTFT